MAVIGERTKERITKQVEGLLTDYLPAIDEAYNKDEKDLSISLNVKLSPHPKNELYVDVVTTMTFVKEKVKDKIEGTVSEVQMELFDGEKKREARA